MRFLVLIAVLFVVYVSLPVTTHVAAQAPPVATESPAEAATADATANGKVADEAQVSSDSSDAEATPTDADSDEKEEEDAAEEDEKASDAKSDDKKDEQPKKEEKDKDEKKERKTHTVDTKRMKVDVTLDGTFAAETMTPVALRPDSWSRFEIVEVVPHGSEVHKGQTLIKFDDEDLNQEIAELELSQRISELTIRRAEEELPRLEKTLKMTAEQTERLSSNTQEDYDRYHKIDRPMLLKSLDYSLRYAQFSLDYQQDELDQLEKMYEADDLTEETEEIVLKRQRNIVDFMKFNLEQTKLYRDEVLSVRLPRNDITIKESLERVALEVAKAKTSLGLDLNRARYELEQLKQSRLKSLDRHAKLLGDRALMTIEAPVDGIVYYGECEDGRWSDMASMISKLKPENSVSTGSVLMTILERRPLEVLAHVDEKKRPDLKAGQAARVVPPSDGADSIDGTLKSISGVPVATGKFAVATDLTGSEVPEWIVPGVSCKVKVNVYDKADAMVVPTKAIHTDDDDDEVKYVWLVDPKEPEAKAERRDVKLGRSKGDDTEITSGLAKGDVISLDDEKAKEKEAADKAKDKS